MKKILIASTALVATSGFAMADVSLSGSAQFGVIYQEDRQLSDAYGVLEDDELFLDYELQFDLSGSTTTDSGLTFGASADFENDSNAYGDSNDQGFDPEIFVSGGFGTLTVGDVDVATDTAFGGLTRDPGYDGIGIDNKIDSLIFADADAGFDTDQAIDSNIMYELAAGGFELTFTADSFEENYAVAIAYDLGSFRFGLGYVDISDYNTNTAEAATGFPDNGGDSVSVFVGGELAGFDWDFVYVQHDNDGGIQIADFGSPDPANDVDLGGEFEATGYGLSASYDLGGYALSFAANYTEIDDTDLDGWDYGIGVSYDLGGGAALQAGIGQIWTIESATETGDSLVASLGMSFKF